LKQEINGGGDQNHPGTRSWRGKEEDQKRKPSTQWQLFGALRAMDAVQTLQTKKKKKK